MKITTPILIACLSLLVGSALVAQADVTINPNSNGATDVVQDPDGAATLLVNPLPDPLDLGGDTLAIGNTGTGELLIELLFQSGNVTSGLGYIGKDSSSTGTVTVIDNGSLWNNSNHLYVGYEGDGTLNIGAGGVVSSGLGTMGFDSGSTGAAIVTAMCPQSDGMEWFCHGHPDFLQLSGTHISLRLPTRPTIPGRDSPPPFFLTKVVVHLPA